MYLTLPSNASSDMFPKNCPSHFTVNLPTQLTLTGKYEVGLCEIHLPFSWDNVTGGSNNLKFLEEGSSVDYVEESIWMTSRTSFRNPISYYNP